MILDIVLLAYQIFTWQTIDVLLFRRLNKFQIV
jgi:hypothetical protein